MATNAELDLRTAERDALQKFVQILHSQNPAGTVASAAGGPGLSPLAAKLSSFQEALSQLKPETLKALPKNFVKDIFQNVEVPSEPLTEASVRTEVESIAEQDRLVKFQENLGRLQKIISSNPGLAEFSLADLAAHDQRVEALSKRIEAGPLTEPELQKALEPIRQISEAAGENRVEELSKTNSDGIEDRKSKAMSKLVTAAGKADRAGLHETVRSRFVNAVEANPKNTESIVKEFAGLQKSIDTETRTLFQRGRAVLSGQLGTEKGTELIAQGKTGAGTKAIRGAKLKGGGIAGALAIPLLLALFRGGGKEGEDGGQPQELDLRQLFLQRQAQELQGNEAKLNSQLGLNDARRTKATAQAEGQLLRNLLLMQQISGGGATSLP